MKFCILKDENMKDQADYYMYICKEEIQEMKESLIKDNERVISPSEADFTVYVVENPDEADIFITYENYPTLSA